MNYIALHDEGLLSAHEFAQRKNGILDSVFRHRTPINPQTRHTSNRRASTYELVKSETENKPATTDLGYMLGQHLLGNGKEYRLQNSLGRWDGQVWQSA